MTAQKGEGQMKPRPTTTTDSHLPAGVLACEPKRTRAFWVPGRNPRHRLPLIPAAENEAEGGREGTHGAPLLLSSVTPKAPRPPVISRSVFCRAQQLPLPWPTRPRVQKGQKEGNAQSELRGRTEERQALSAATSPNFLLTF